jgi:hypothetical protein
LRTRLTVASETPAYFATAASLVATPEAYGRVRKKWIALPQAGDGVTRPTRYLPRQQK